MAMPPTRDLAPVLRAARSVLLTTHSGPDGDGLGCIAALGDTLRARGVRVLQLLPDPLPTKYSFLDPDRLFLPLENAGSELETQAWDVALVLDTHQWSLLRGVGVWLREQKLRTLFLDHHPQEGEDRPEVYGSCDAVATGILVYHLLARDLGWPISSFAAEALYTSISFDTNSFKYIRSDAESLVVGAELVRLGVDTTRVYRHLFASNPLRKARFIGWVLSSVEFLCEGRLAFVRVPHRLVDEMKLERDDLRDAVNHLLEIEGVEIAATLKETDPGEIKVSLRSKGSYVVNGIASALGGGGHALAAGLELSCTLEEAWQRLLSPLSAVLREPPKLVHEPCAERAGTGVDTPRTLS